VSASLEGYVAYQRREYCKAIACPVQVRLDALRANSQEYQEVRNACTTAYVHTTYEFHHWLIEHGYLLVRPAT